MRLRLLALLCWVVWSVPVMADANSGPMGGHAAVPGLMWGSMAGVRDNGFSWRRGHWWHGNRARRFGWWWVVGPAWYWYPFAVYPGPAFYPPPYLPPGYSYWCDFNLNYFPNVPYLPDCPTGWQAVPSQ